ncbi:AraC family transcriptional regulator [Rhizobacter sp. Root1221]|uniref:AraC family transcriptional regulator n=1 Tax=Rhizobacter sp. Root1221 TaxID=1736433 RepID=UPI0006F835D8|nr:AraC family transcriptional regulator [Rhizobacter sp. Root1221]KQV86321.1 cupin [Rhizobacter sp. Root1221]
MHTPPPSGPWPSADPLGEALHALRMSAVFCCRSEVRAPWGVTMPPMPGCAMFHVVTEGLCWVDTGDGAPRRLQPGGFVLVPHGEGHALVSQPDTPRVDLFDLPRAYTGGRYELLRFGGSGDPATLLCGAVRFDDPAARRLIAMLPRALWVDGAESAWMQSTLQHLAVEARQMRPGGEAVVTRLADILIIQALRAWIENDPSARTGWIGGLQDRAVGAALAGIHRDPAFEWTLVSLASAAAMSRSAFAARFTQLVGVPPMQYVAQWRMHVAHARLSEHGGAIPEVAEGVGYHSEAAFSRAFKRHLGVAPGEVARRAPRARTPA